MSLPPFALERFFAKHEFTARHLLCCSDCETVSVAELLAMEPGAEEALHGLRLGYTESLGSPSLRRQIARQYPGLDAASVITFAGAEEAIFLFMHAALGPGDHAVVHCPCYQSLTAVAESVGCAVTRWEAREEDGWALDPSALPGLLRPNTRVVVINTPHNPTGYLMPRVTMERIARITEERGITLFSDEVYRGLEADPAARLPAACCLGERTISLGVMSKTYGLAGLRVGWLATRDAALRARVASLKDYTTICSSGPSELLAEVALRHAEELAVCNRRIIASNLDLLDAFFAGRADLFTWRRPAAGPIAFPRLNHGDAAVFCDDLVREAGVLLLPGTVYRDTGNHFRVGFGRADMPRALAALEEHLGRRAG
jgi:aspartate/methionine/tyrosine aminotransferase